MAKSSVNVTQAYEMLKNDEAVLVDVREPQEFKTERIANACSVPLSEFDSAIQKLHVPESKTILFQCAKGKRSDMACDRVGATQQFKNNIVNVEGGIEAWKAAGLPTIRSDALSASGAKTNIPVQRQVMMAFGLVVAVLVLIGYTGVQAAFMLTGVLGVAYCLAGLTGICMMERILMRMPWNR